MGLIPPKNAREKKHKADTFELSHPRGERTVVFTYQTPWVGVGVNSQGLPGSIMGGKVSTSDQEQQKNASADH